MLPSLAMLAIEVYDILLCPSCTLYMSRVSVSVSVSVRSSDSEPHSCGMACDYLGYAASATHSAHASLKFRTAPNQN
jgi:hypothetical protein